MFKKISNLLFLTGWLVFIIFILSAFSYKLLPQGSFLWGLMLGNVWAVFPKEAAGFGLAVFYFLLFGPLLFWLAGFLTKLKKGSIPSSVYRLSANFSMYLLIIFTIFATLRI